MSIAAGSDRPDLQALVYAGLADKDRTLEALDRVAARSAQRLGVFLGYPDWRFCAVTPG